MSKKKKKEHAVSGFRTGRHVTEKDRPRNKDWKREYYKSKEPGRYREDIGSGSFFVKPNVMQAAEMLPVHCHATFLPG